MQCRLFSPTLNPMPATDLPILGRMLRPLTSQLRHELLHAVAKLEADPADENRYHLLADLNAEGAITPEERRELDGIVSANTLLSVLRVEARAALKSRAG